MASQKTFKVIATKLGLADEQKVISKAGEFERLLSAKSTTGHNLNDTNKLVICLDLAAAFFEIDFDTKLAAKYSGLKNVTYTNIKKVVENLLELNTEKLTTSMLCVALQCGNVQVLADNILDKFMKQSTMELDINLPHYVCMAVYQACRVSKVKVSKSKFIEKSRLKPAQWAKLDAEWRKFVDDNFSSVKMKRGTTKNIEVIEDTGTLQTELAKEENVEIQIEIYEDWKRRILEAAHKEVKEMKEIERTAYKENVTPRRTPRKSHKISPYKSPTKSSTVRLLFPC